MTDVRAIQRELRASGIDGWLFYDILHRDPIAYRVLGLGEAMAKRRWFYLIPARGAPRKLVHRIEAGMLDGLPGSRQAYSSREELEAGLRRLTNGERVVAMQYSPRNNNPYVGTVDAGTVELVRAGGVRVVSSADLVQKFEARWSAAQWRSHRAAGGAIDRIVAAAFARAGDFLRRGRRLTEYDLQQWIADRFAAAGIVADSPAIVAAGPNSGNPHYEPTARAAAVIRPGRVLLLDVWGKTTRPDSVYYDVTWTGFGGERIPAKVDKIFQIVRQARDGAIGFVQQAVAEGRAIEGWQVDRACRRVIERAGYGRWFTHRTGHNIGREVHGNGASMDDLEMHDDRRVLARTCFSIEPGIYLPEFGIRSEVNVYVDERKARVTGAAQTAMIPLMAPAPRPGRVR
ncbi:MAG TPA: M24 family metallopeptidase [Candidatus Acidoferrales bacterium]|nr:M24 family metallopeptidase [Candidatus Acidoferrales bacterium]